MKLHAMDFQKTSTYSNAVSLFLKPYRKLIFCYDRLEEVIFPGDFYSIHGALS